jgi:CYRIA/CYRIB Rac1 binding domain
VTIPVDATPSDHELVVHSKMQEVLNRSDAILSSIGAYDGCQSLVQKAISTPTSELPVEMSLFLCLVFLKKKKKTFCTLLVCSFVETPDENMAECWNALKPAVARLREYWEFTEQIQANFPELIRALCEDGVASNQALSKQLAALLDFVIRFDHIKLNTPSIQNDFSYYRRSLQRMRANNVQEEGILADDVAHKLSMFYASPTPAMTVLVQSVMSAGELQQGCGVCCSSSHLVLKKWAKTI